VARAHRYLVPLVLAVAMAGCRSVESVRLLPLDQGIRAVYRVPAEEVEAAGRAGLEDVKAGRVEQSPPDSGWTLLMGARATGLFEFGSVTRLAVGPSEAGGGTEVRVLSRSVNPFDLSGHAARFPPRTLAAVDRRLGPDAVAPFEGLRVRGSWPGVDGGDALVRRDAAGAWVADSDGVTRRLDDALGLEAYRGSYGHQLQWATALWLVGLVAGFYGSDGNIYGMEAGAVGGAIVGMLIGAAHRTEVWSPMAPPGAARLP